MKRFLMGSLLVAALAAPAWVGPASVSAACAPPSISVDPASAPRGGGFTVTGSGFFINCPSDDPQDPTRTPEERVPIKFDQGGKTWDIGTAFPNSAGRINATVYVPDGDGYAEAPKASASEGSATVRAVSSQGDPTAPFRVEPGQSDADNTAAGVPPGGSTTSTTAGGATTTTRPATGTTTTTARRSTTTVRDIETTTTTEADELDEASSTTTLLRAEPTTSTTTVIAAPPRVSDDNSDDTLRIVALVAAAAGILGVLGYLLYRSRVEADEL